MAGAKKEWKPGANLHPVAIGDPGDPPGYTFTIRMTHEDLVAFYRMLKANGNNEYVSLIEGVVPQIAEEREKAKTTIANALRACERCEQLRPFVPNDEKRVRLHYENGHE
jgi:hypothetical protein